MKKILENLKNPYGRIATLIIITLIIASFHLLTSFFYIGQKERELINTLEQSEASSIPIQQIVSIDWDVVCTSTRDSLGHHFSSPHADEKATREINKTRVALAFLKDQKLVELFDFRSVENLKFGNKRVIWRGRFKNKYCLKRDEASFGLDGESKELVFQPLSLGRKENE